MNDFTLLEKDLESLNAKIEDFTSNLKFEEIGKFKLSESEKITLDLKESLKCKGIYFLEIQNSVENKDIKKWKNDFLKNWEDDKINKSPKVILDRLNNHSEFEEWIPLYVGKSENIGKRIKDHFCLKNESTTYALKLNSRKSIINTAFRLSVIEIKTDYYDLVVHKIEHILRKRYNPIVGKQ